MQFAHGNHGTPDPATIDWAANGEVLNREQTFEENGIAHGCPI